MPVMKTGEGVEVPYDFAGFATGKTPLSSRLLGKTRLAKNAGGVIDTDDYGFPAPRRRAVPGKNTLAGKLNATAPATTKRYEDFLQGLGDDAPAGKGKKSGFGTRPGITGIAQVDAAIYQVEDGLDDLQSALTLQSAAAVFSLLGIGYLILRGR